MLLRMGTVVCIEHDYVYNWNAKADFCSYASEMKDEEARNVIVYEVREERLYSLHKRPLF